MNENKVYLGTFKRATSKAGSTYYWGSFGGARAVMFETKSGDGLNLYVSERPVDQDKRTNSAEESLTSAVGGDSIPF